MRDKKKMMILVSLITVVGVSIGFVAFLSSLLIKSSLSIKPTYSEFEIILSSSSTSLSTSDVSINKVPSTIEVSSDTINNSGTYPTIENLGTIFKEPGKV